MVSSQHKMSKCASGQKSPEVVFSLVAVPFFFIFQKGISGNESQIETGEKQ